MRTYVVTLGFVLTLDGPSFLMAQELKANPDKLALVGSRISGDWELIPDLSDKLGRRGRTSISFKIDATVLENKSKFDKIPDRTENYLKKHRIYAAGLVRLGNEKDQYPFVLISLFGSPRVTYFIPKGANAFGNPESLYVFVVAAGKHEDDILFVGGDTETSAFAAFRRKLDKKDAK